MFNFFGWIRRQVAEAVKAGLGDALAELQPTEPTGPAIALLESRLAPVEASEASNGHANRIKGKLVKGSA